MGGYTKWWFSASYILSGLFIKFYTSYLYSTDIFSFPITFSFYEQFVTYIFCRNLFPKSKLPHNPTLYRWFGLFSIICAVDYCMENMALNTWRVSMNEIVRSVSPLFTAFFQFQHVSGIKWGVLSFITFGVVLSVFETTEGFVWMGLFFSGATVVTSSLQSILQTKISDRFSNVQASDFLMKSALPVMFMIFFFMVRYEGADFSQTLIKNPFSSLYYIFVDSVAVFINHYSLTKIITMFGPVNASIMDCLLTVSAIIWSEFAVDREKFNLWRWVGIFIVIVGFVFNLYIEKKEEEEKEQEENIG